MERQRRTVDERKLLAQVVAQRHLEREMSLVELARDLGISERGARQLYRTARDEKLVRVTVTPTYSAPPVLDRDLAAAITARPSMLRRAIVVQVPPSQAPDYDDLLHRQLASATAQHLLDELHDGDTLAVTGGRGPAYTADAVEELLGSGKRFERVQVLSVCGGSVRRLPKTSSQSVPLDADIVADALSRALDLDPVDTRLVLLPLALADKPELEDVVPTVAPHVTEEWWRNNRVDICLVGAGVLTDKPEYFLQHHFRAHADDLTALVDELDEQVLSQEEPGLVADVAQRLWLTRDVANIDPSVANEVIRRINRRLIGADLRSLDRAREKILVAGGDPKYAALRGLVLGARCDFRPSTLITDSVTAMRLRDDLGRQRRFPDSSA